MKIAVFSDIHGNYQALKAILSKIEKNEYDKVIFLGDAVGLGPDGDGCVELLNKSNIIWLLGNHDLYCTRGSSIDKEMDDIKIKHHDWVMTTLKHKIKDENNLSYEFNYLDTSFKFFHYFLNDNIYPYESLSILKTDEYKKVYNKIDVDYVFYGHSHEERYDEINNKHYFGIGSSGCVKNSKTYFYSIELFDDIKIKKVKVNYNRKKFENRINNINYPDKQRVENIFFGIK